MRLKLNAYKEKLTISLKS